MTVLRDLSRPIAKAEKGFEVVAREDTNGTFDSALEAAKKILNEQPDITAIMCGNDQMAVAAKTALNLAGNDQTVVYSIDGSPMIKKGIKKGRWSDCRNRCTVAGQHRKESG